MHGVERGVRMVGRDQHGQAMIMTILETAENRHAQIGQRAVQRGDSARITAETGANRALSGEDPLVRGGLL